MSALDGLADILSEVIAAEGLGGTVIHTSRGEGAGYNPATSAATPSETPSEVMAVIGPVTRELKQGVGVQAGDVMVSGAPSAFSAEPTERDSINIGGSIVAGSVVGGVSYAVVAVVVTRGGADPVWYDLQCRRV